MRLIILQKMDHGGNDQQSPQIHTSAGNDKKTFGLRNDVLTVGETSMETNIRDGQRIFQLWSEKNWTWYFSFKTYGHRWSSEAVTGNRKRIHYHN